jgi:hypothetical protein
MKKIHRKIAKEYGVTVSELKKEMQKAINHACRGSAEFFEEKEK